MEYLGYGFLIGVSIFLFIWFPYGYKIPKKTGDDYEDYGYPYDKLQNDDARTRRS